jgi:uncharacterized protein (DUF3820 family)
MPIQANQALRDKVKALALEGMTAIHIAGELGVSYYTVQHYIRVLLADNALPYASQRKPRTKGYARKGFERIRMKYGVHFGRMTDFVADLPEDHLVWIVGQIPKGGTFADVLRAIIVDAYEDEKDV